MNRNADIVLTALREEGGGVSLAELVLETGLPRHEIQLAVTELARDGKAIHVTNTVATTSGACVTLDIVMLPKQGFRGVGLSEPIKGLATLICWGCHEEVAGIPGRMDDNAPEGSLFFSDETFKCPSCEAEDDYAWSAFEESE